LKKKANAKQTYHLPRRKQKNIARVGKGKINVFSAWREKWVERTFPEPVTEARQGPHK